LRSGKINSQIWKLLSPVVLSATPVYCCVS